MKLQQRGRSGNALDLCVIWAGLSIAAFSTTSAELSTLQDTVTIKHTSPPVLELSTSSTLSFASITAVIELSSSTSKSQAQTFPANVSSAESQSRDKSNLNPFQTEKESASSKYHKIVNSGGAFNSSTPNASLQGQNHIESSLAIRTASNKSHALPTITQKPYPVFLFSTNSNSNETHHCKAWGPLCQTGSTVVSVREHNTIATTTVPCSSYLSAQAYSVRHNTASLSSWRSHFGRSPQCTAYAESQQNEDSGRVPNLLASCGEQASTLSDIDIYPPGIYKKGGLNETDKCCGPCAIFVPRVNLRYFPQDSDVSCGADGDAARSSMVTAAPKPMEARTSLFVSNGFTYTSPSLYFEIMGTASFMDDCGQLGIKHVSSTLAIPPGVMSTVSFDVPVGAVLPRGSRASELRHLAPLKTRDLACPTWGVNMPVATDPAQEVRIAYPFYPLLVPPPELIAIDAAWSKCFTNHWPMRFGIFDPPCALTANSVMVGSTTLPVPQPELTLTTAAQLSATPAAMSSSHAPIATPTAIKTFGLHQMWQEPHSNLEIQPPSTHGTSGSGDDFPSKFISDLKMASPVIDLSKTESNHRPERPSIEAPHQRVDAGVTPYPSPTAAHAITIGVATYTEGVDCSCYSFAPNKILKHGNSITVVDSLVVSLASVGEIAVIDGTTQQLSPAITGVAPAFANVLDIHQFTQVTTSRSSKITLSNEMNITVASLRATTTISANGFTLTAALVTGSSNLVVLGSTEETLIPGGTALTLKGGEVISLGPDGVLKLRGKPFASTFSVLPDRGGQIGAAVATAFLMGISETKSDDVRQASETATKTSSNNINRPLQGGQVKPVIPWVEIWLVTWGSLFLCYFGG